MRNFYNKALISLMGLLILSCVMGYVCITRTFLHSTLLPKESSDFPWVIHANADITQGGASRLQIDDDQFSLSFNFTVSPQLQYPFASADLQFTDATGKTALVDLSQFDRMTFNVKCSPTNTLAFVAATFDEKVSKTNDILSYRAPTTFFSCDENWKPIELDLTRMETPQWWFDMFKLELSEREYRLNKVLKISFGSSYQSPRNQFSKVQLNDIQLKGRDWHYFYLLAALILLIWSGYAYWIFKFYTRHLIRELQDKIQRDRPLVAYQQLSLEPHKDKDRGAILRYMATEYAKPELSLDQMVAQIGVSRTKINDTLKTELGYTFTGYLNKLRLTEAARLLAEKDEANIAEIAYSVGYNNVSYFNKLFKEEYGCTPKNFKSLYESKEA